MEPFAFETSEGAVEAVWAVTVASRREAVNGSRCDAASACGRGSFDRGQALARQRPCCPQRRAAYERCVRARPRPNAGLRRDSCSLKAVLEGSQEGPPG